MGYKHLHIFLLFFLLKMYVKKYCQFTIVFRFNLYKYNCYTRIILKSDFFAHVRMHDVVITVNINPLN